MEDSTKEKIEELARQKRDGKSYSEIRTELHESGISREEISNLLRKVDEKVLENPMGRIVADQPRKWYRTGVILASIGLIISIAFNAGIILNDLPAMAAYTPFFAGIILMLYGKLLQRRKTPKPETGPGPIRKKRPYK